MKKYINILFLLGFLLFSFSEAYSQCNNTSAWGSGTAPTGGGSITLTTCAFAGEYSTINSVVAGQAYTSTSSGTDHWITIRQGTPGGPVIAFGPTPLSWVASVSDTYYQHVNTNQTCGTASSCLTQTVIHVPNTCTNSFAWGSGTAPTGGNIVTLTTCAFTDEYSTINSVVAGSTYQSSGSPGTDFITITQGSPSGPVIAAGPIPLNWYAPVSGTYYHHYKADATCGTDGNCHTGTIQCISCAPPPPSPCLNTSQYPSGCTNAGTGSVVTITTCNFAGEYSCISGISSGGTYQFTATGGLFITVREGSSGGPVVDFGSTPLTVTATSNSDLYVHWNLPGCGTDFNCYTTTVQCISNCAPPPSCPGGLGTGVFNVTLPYTTTGATTCGMVDDLTSSNTITCGSTSYTSAEDVVYIFTPPSTGAYDINLTSNSSWVGLKLYDGCPLLNSTGAGSCIANISSSSGNQSLTNQTLTFGVTYYLWIDQWASPTCIPSYDLFIGPAAPPPTNDLCVDAITVTCGGTYTGNTSATSNIGNPSFFCGTGASTAGGVWYKFIGNGDQITASLCGSSYDTKIFVYDGSCSSLNCVVGNDDFCGLQSEVSFTSNVGTEYYILVAGFGSSTGAFTLNMTCAPPPPNPCNNVTVISSCGDPQTASFSGNGSWNTTSCGFSTFGQEYIYEFTAPTAGNYTISVTSSTGGWVDYFWKTGSCGETGWTCLGDVFSAGAVLPYSFNPSFTLTAGQTVYIQLSAEGTGAVTQTFEINCPVPPPANDDCSGAIALICGQTVTGNTFGGTPETGTLPSCPTNSYNGISKGLWYTFTGNGQTVIASLCGSSYDTWINVYEGSCGTFTCIAGNDDACGLQSEVSFGTTIGNTYYILVSGWSTSSGAFTLNVTCCNPPANDVCTAVTPVAITPGVPQIFTGNSLCSSAEGPLTVPVVWHAITTTTITNLSVSYCGTTPVQTTVYQVLSTICPPAGVYPDPTYILGSTSFAICLDGNGVITYNNLPAGTYYIPVAAAPAGPYSFTVSAECAFSASVSTSQTGTCNLINLSADVTPSGSYNYSWTGSGIVNPSSATTQAQVSATGTYSVLVTDAFGCSATASTLLDFDNGPDINLTASETLICGTGAVTLNAGFNNASQSGFAGQYDPSTWTTVYTPPTVGGSVDASSAPSSITIVSGNNSIAGSTAFTHVALVTGNITFDWTYTTVDGSQYDYPRYSINGVTTIMPGYSTSGSTAQNGTASIAVVAGQTFGLEMYTVDGVFGSGQVVISNIVFPGNLPLLAWTPAGSLSDAAINAPVATITATETFTVAATDPASGCSSSNSITIYADPVPTPVINPSSDIYLCAGETGIASTQYLAGDGYTFDWGLVTTETYEVSVPDFYTMYVTSPNGCTSDPVNYTVYTTDVVPDLSFVTDALCYGDNTGLVEIIPLGTITEPGFSIYTGPFDYSMDGGPLQSSPIFTGLSAGIYNFEMHDPVSGCFASVVETVGEPDPLVGSTSVISSPTCFGGSDGSATASATGGTGPYTFDWLTPVPKSGENNNELPAGTWTVVVTDANGCTSTTTVTINEPDPVTVDLGPDRVVAYGSTNGYTAIGCTDIVPIISGGTGNIVSYLWSNGDITPTLSGVCNPVNGIDGTYIYTVTVTDDAGCVGTGSVTLIWSNIDCSNNTNGTKLKICHMPPGNPGACQTICISVSAASVFLGNGSAYIGSCNPGCAPARIIAPEPIADMITVNVMPNPTNGKLLVDFSSDGQIANAIQVRDVQGRLLMTVTLDAAASFTSEIDLSSLENGLYMLNIMNKDGVISTSRVVKAE